MPVGDGAHTSAKGYAGERAGCTGCFIRKTLANVEPALSVAAASDPPNLTLPALGRLDLALYTMAGALCARRPPSRALVCMAPALVRPHGPERRATAHVLNLVAAHIGAPGADRTRTRTAAATAVHTAWQTLLSSGTRTEARRALARLVAHAEAALAAPDAAPAALSAARRHLSASLLELRATTGAAAGEWWQRAWPSERVTHAEQAGHRTLTATVRRHGFQASEGARA
ncbi:hypothetical protein [Streptomyces capitiformicae]|uniref:Uncharacterized protein n=1 Tax=Streptomyces capitiformicae TaxID=2014920 RepID=A0A918ZV97_9ACTN|nr:hypothetical protein GCM10017771_95800 [Streptomyces capitiformicae]